MLIVRVRAVVILVVLLPRLAQGTGALDDLALALLKAVAFIGATLLLGARVVPELMARVDRLGSPELFLLTAVTLALGTAAVSAALGLSAALGAFMGGLMLTETEFNHRVVAEVVPMRNLFATLFFVSVGMLIDPAFIARNLPAVLGLAPAASSSPRSSSRWSPSFPSGWAAGRRRSLAWGCCRLGSSATCWRERDATLARFPTISTASS